MLLLQADVLLGQEVLQRLCYMVKQLQGENRRTDKKVRPEQPGGPAFSSSPLFLSQSVAPWVSGRSPPPSPLLLS